MALRFREAAVAVKAETTKGTAISLAGTDAVYLAYDVAIAADREISSRSPIRGTLSNVITAGKTTGSVSFRAEVVPSGTAGTAPDMSAALLACGLALTTSAGVSDTYAPETTTSSFTVGVFHDGVKYILKGALASCSLSATVGEPMMATFTFTGLFDDVTDESNPTISYGTVSTPVMVGVTCTVGGTSCSLANWSMEIGHEIAIPTSATGAMGLTDYAIPMGRTISGSLDPLLELVATRDDFGVLAAGTEQDIILTVGDTAGSKFTITVNDALLSKVSVSDREGAAVANLEWQSGSAAGDDEFELKFF
jgi:hypothetical protein